MKNWFELIKQAGIAPVVVHDEEQYPAELVRLCELVAADAEAREQAALRLLDQNRAISEDNFTKLNGWMHACLAAESQRDALLAYNQTRTDELQAAVEQAKQFKDRLDALAFRIGVACEVQIVSGAYDRIRNEKVFAVDDLEYDLFAEGWKAAIASLTEGGAS